MSELTASHKQTGTFVYINNYRGYVAKLLTSTLQSPVSHEWHVQTWGKFTSKTITASRVSRLCNYAKQTHEKTDDSKGYKATPITGDIPTNYKRSEKINPWLRAVSPEAHILSCLMIVLIALKQQCFSATDIVEDSHNFYPGRLSFCYLFKQVKSCWNQLILVLTWTHNGVFFHSLCTSHPEFQCIPFAKMQMDWQRV